MAERKVVVIGADGQVQQIQSGDLGLLSDGLAVGRAAVRQADSGNTLAVVNNAYLDGTTWKYKETDQAVGFALNLDGDFIVYTAASGTADTAIPLAVALKVLNAGTLELPYGQVKFPATQNASADANTLDDYEEGTWTPVLTFATPGTLSVAYTSRGGSYRKIGSFVALVCFLVTSSYTLGTASGAMQITGAPFNGHSVESPGAAGGQYQGINKTNFTAVVAQINSSAIITFTASGMGQTASSVFASDTATGTNVRHYFSLPYVTDN